MDFSRVFLLSAAIGLTPIALAYGLMPSVTVPLLYGIDIDSTNIAHIFRAVMGLYLGMVVFWILGATRASLRLAAIYSLVVFMSGLAIGRLASLFLDGMASGILILFLLLELAFAVVGFFLLKKRTTHLE